MAWAAAVQGLEEIRLDHRGWPGLQTAGERWTLLLGRCCFVEEGRRAVGQGAWGSGCAAAEEGVDAGSGCAAVGQGQGWRWRTVVRYAGLGCAGVLDGGAAAALGGGDGD